MFKFFAAVVASAAFCLTSLAQDQFCKVWYTQDRDSKVQLFLAADGTYYGKIVWIKNPTPNGKPLLDVKNPDESKRKQTYLGLQMISGLQKKSATELVSGKVYDPTHGNYYSCKMSIKEPGKLELRGYIMGMPFLGRTVTWFLAEDTVAPVLPKVTYPSLSPATKPVGNSNL